jgi:beta-lactamase superfamily II metal-dependent hydrolase
LSGQGYFLSILSPDNKSDFYKEINGTLSPSSEQIDCISAVVYLKVNGVRFLFTGDAKYAVEEKIKLNYLNKVYNTFYQNELVALEDIDFLKVSNGGADGCSGREFLELLKPKNAIIFTSGNSAPSNLVLNRLYESNKDYKLYRTDVYGTITVSQMSKGNYKIFTEA